jgi:chromosome partitioning protein
MRVIALANEKGGVGKTSVCINLACYVAWTGATAAIIDMDPQRSTMNWGKRRGEGSNPETVSAQPSDLDKTIKAMRSAGVAWCFLDLPGRSAPVTSVGLKASHLILIPSRPFELDLEGSRDVVAAAHRLRKPYAFLMNIAPPNSSRVRDVTASLREASHKVSPVVIHQRVAVADAVSEGKGVIETEPRGSSAAEFGNLQTWIDDIVG